jgi:hypothetical protein
VVGSWEACIVAWLLDGAFFGAPACWQVSIKGFLDVLSGWSCASESLNVFFLERTTVERHERVSMLSIVASSSIANAGRIRGAASAICLADG